MSIIDRALDRFWKCFCWLIGSPVRDECVTISVPEKPAVPPVLMVDGFPRRARLELNTEAERAIRFAMLAVEESGAGPLLTVAVNLLSHARDVVADHVDRTWDKDAERPYEPCDATLNICIAGNLYLRRWAEDWPDTVFFVMAESDDDRGVVLAITTLSVLASVICCVSPNQEKNGGHGYVQDFLEKGTILCAGCGNPIKDPAGTISVIDRPVCMPCYEAKFKPYFDEICGRCHK